MNKAHKALGAMMVVLSVAVSGLCFAAWRPVTPAIVEALQGSQPRKAVPELAEAPPALAAIPAAKEAPKARPAAARAKKTWQCGERIVLEAGPKARTAEPSSARSCGWR